MPTSGGGTDAPTDGAPDGTNQPSGPFPHVTIGLLGVVTITAYGTWYYAFGVLLDPILVDTGWSEGWVAGTYALATTVGALLALPAGRIVDRIGGRPVFAIAAALAVAGLVTASYARALPVFVAGALTGAAALQAFCFYHVTQTTAVRAAPDRANSAIAVLTVYGAFASMIYLPLAALLVEATGWRATLRILVLGTAAVLVAAAVGVRERERPPRPIRGRQGGADGDSGDGGSGDGGGGAGGSGDGGSGARGGGLRGEGGRGEGGPASPERKPPASVVRSALSEGPTRRYALATALIGLAVGTVLVYQVPLMVDAGLPVATAAWLAGARGAAQVTGRIPLGWILRRLEARAAVRLAFAAITVGVAMLALAGNLVFALAYVAVAGFGIGATSPLQGIYATELFERSQLGESMGLLTMVFGLSTAVGPAVVGVLSEVTGTRLWGIGIAVVTASSAVLVLRPGPSAAPEGVAVA